MKRYLRIAALVAVLAVVAAACGGGGDEPSGGTTTSGGAAPKGGTLSTVMTQDFFHGLDPTAEYYSVSWEFLRCCMARTMLSYNGKPAEEGGGDPQPDLAADMPTVSEDGLTWTFTIKDGVMFGDPLNREITAQDFVNSINRLSDPKINATGYPFYYTAIKGFSDAKGGQVEGVVATDEKTLTVTLDQAEPDMPYLFSMAASAPIPTELIEDHYDAVELGQFLVSSGPYQWEGMTADFDLAGKPAGEIAGHFIPPGMMGGLNADYDPYATEGNKGDPAKAKEEMAQSKYDSDGDGVCDDPSCNVQALAVTNDNDAIKALEIMDASFQPIGISLDIKTLSYNALVGKCSTLASKTAFCQAGWGKDYPSPYTFFFPLLDGGENGSNYSFMGATADDLTAAGYSGFETDDAGLAVPNITQDIVACREIPIGPDQTQCWADLDVKVTEELASQIPRRFPNDIDVLSARVVAYSYDQFTGVGAVDQIAVSG